jgi:hypothetical protein
MFFGGNLSIPNCTSMFLVLRDRLKVQGLGFRVEDQGFGELELR